MLVGGVFETPVVQVPVEGGLVDRVHWSDPHRDGGELPEVRQLARVRVRGQPQQAAVDIVAVFLAEAIELVAGEPPLKKSPGIHARRGVPLEEDLVPSAGSVLAAEEMIQAHLVQRRRRGVGRDVSADSDAGALGAVHHDRGVPAQQAPEIPFGLLVAGVGRLDRLRDRVHEVGRRQRRHADLLLAGAIQQPQHQVSGAVTALYLDQTVQRFEPLSGLVRVGIGKIRRKSVEDRPALIAWDHCVYALSCRYAHPVAGHLVTSSTPGTAAARCQRHLDPEQQADTRANTLRWRHGQGVHSRESPGPHAGAFSARSCPDGTAAIRPGLGDDDRHVVGDGCPPPMVHSAGPPAPILGEPAGAGWDRFFRRLGGR